MSKKIFFIVLTCCLLLATFCVSFAGAPQVQHAPANVRAVLDRPDCLAAPLIVPPVVEPFNFPVQGTDWVFDVNSYVFQTALTFPVSGVFGVSLDVDSFTILTEDASEVYVQFLGFSSNVAIDSSSETAFFTRYAGPYLVLFDNDTLTLSSSSGFDLEVVLSSSIDGYAFFSTNTPVALFDGNDQMLSVNYFLSSYFRTSDIISPIFSTFVSGLRSLGANVGRAFSTMANAIFINADGTGLSMFGILVVVFAAISLGLSLTRWVLNFCSSWGNRNR